MMTSKIVLAFTASLVVLAICQKSHASKYECHQGSPGAAANLSNTFNLDYQVSKKSVTFWRADALYGVLSVATIPDDEQIGFQATGKVSFPLPGGSYDLTLAPLPKSDSNARFLTDANFGKGFVRFTCLKNDKLKLPAKRNIPNGAYASPVRK